MQLAIARGWSRAFKLLIKGYMEDLEVLGYTAEEGASIPMQARCLPRYFVRDDSYLPYSIVPHLRSATLWDTPTFALAAMRCISPASCMVPDLSFGA